MATMKELSFPQMYFAAIEQYGEADASRALAGFTIALALALPLSSGSARAADCVDTTLEAVEAGREETALPKLEKGARDGDERCKFILGMWSLSGIGVERNAEVGAQWLREAAMAGLPVAQANLGILYASGVGVAKDDELH